MDDTSWASGQHVAHKVGAVFVGFNIQEHPKLGYRKEDRIDLATAWDTDIYQGAFMGTAILRIGEVDFGTPPWRKGWRGLVEWSLNLDCLLQGIRADSEWDMMSYPDGVEWALFHRTGGALEVTCSFVENAARAEAGELHDRILQFLHATILWFDSNYPAAVRNAEAKGYWERLKLYREI
ncbi:hypothetical protein [Cellulomonas sp. FA1]|uniref:hypothetical protein n=1 Tax=Cellulomonas sp. FA1 TaxID=1346710 RepID=UPI00128CB80A|nr:hypothetical protein [Cellulomonas sp. FA1]